MGHRHLLTTAAVFVIALAAALFGATLAVNVIEDRSRGGVESALILEGHEWAEVSVDGLQVALSGTAPDEVTRFAALRTAGRVVDGSRVIDRMDVAERQSIAPPRFSIEILRNDDGISLIGLFPALGQREALLERVRAIAGDKPVTDLMESAAFPAPAGWDAAVDFGLTALDDLAQSKVSISARRVTVTAMANSEANRSRIERRLQDAAPDSAAVTLDISAPRPVITPFTFRVVLTEDGASFDACSAETEDGRGIIMDAIAALPQAEDPDCVIGIGAPSPEWAHAVAAGLETLARLGEGTLTYSDSNVSLVGTETTAREAFDTEVGTLEAALPRGFSLTAVLSRPEDAANEDAGPPRFTATRSPEGLVQLRGRVVDARTRAALVSMAEARFGRENISDGLRETEGLPDGWMTRVMAAMDALALLEKGAAVVAPDSLRISGTTGIREARAEIARRLSAELGDGASFDIQVTYEERFDPVANLPSPETCVARINEAMGDSRITFEPGSDDIDASALQVLNDIADVLRDCRDVDMQIEVAGHTDSQGRAEMNQSLSQARAEAVIDALLARRVLTGNLVARGYGEEFPIADNDTEDGREANRRIEFSLVGEEDETDAPADAEGEGETPEAEGEAETGGENTDENGEAAGEDAQNDEQN